MSTKAATTSALYGKGIFTTIRINNGEPFLWEKHWGRLTANAAAIGIDLSQHSEQSTLRSLGEIIKNDGVENGRARLTFYDDSPSPMWPTGDEQKTTLSIITGPVRPSTHDLRLTLSPYPVNSRSPLAGVKSCNYLENLLAYDDVKQRGFDEGLRVNEYGHVASACMANVFWLRGDRLYTPSLRTGCLPGTTREFILERLDCVEVEATTDDLISADSIFLTSAGLGVVQAGRLDDRPIKISTHPILDLVPAY